MCTHEHGNHQHCHHVHSANKNVDVQDIQFEGTFKDYLGFGYSLIDKDVSVFRFHSNNEEDVHVLLKDYCDNMFLENEGISILEVDIDKEVRNQHISKKVNQILQKYKNKYEVTTN